MQNKNNIPYVNLGLQWMQEKKNLLPIIDKILSSGQYVGGQEINKFEKNILKFINNKYCVGVNSGTDALTLGLHLIGIKKNDEIITPPNSFIASTATIMHLGAKPVFADVLINQNINPKSIEKVITKKTKAIMPVHLTGRICEMDKIKKIAKKYNLLIIEDCAQSIGSKYNNKFSGSFGDIGCFSTHPLKNLNSCGDGGFISTNDKYIYRKAKKLINHGIIDRNKVESFGYVSRMDNLQAAILNYRLKKLNNIIFTRRRNAEYYIKNLNSKKILLPYENINEFNTYHTFVIQVENRDALKDYLIKLGIETAIHYPQPIHLQPAAKKLNYKKGSFPIAEMQSKKIISLPIHQNLEKNELEIITDAINSFVN